MSHHHRSRDKNSRHHRKCRSNGGTDESRNISWVNKYDHQAYHMLFQNFEAERIAEILNNIWIDPAWELIARKR
jgi:hypothetical protein